MKAILVLDVDEKEIGREFNYISVKGGGMSYIVGTMKSGVRLKPLPQKKEVKGDFYKQREIVTGLNDLIDFDKGYNKCIDEILGETE